MFYVRGRLSALLFACFVASLFHVQGVSGVGPSARDHLIQDLLKDYHSSVEPSGVIDLRFGLSLMCARFDKVKVKLTTNAWERYTWNDFRLSWNPKDYDGIKKMRVPASLVWKPDIDCYNAIEQEERTSENILIDYDGTVMWVPRAFYRTLCAVEDGKPVCDLSFGSWTYDQWSMSLELDGPGVDLSIYLNTTCPWSIENYTAAIKTSTYPCCKESYSSLDITLNLKPSHPEEIKEE